MSKGKRRIDLPLACLIALATAGANGGKPGSPAIVKLKTPDGKVHDLPSKGAFKVPGGSIVDMITPGSGGFGDPAGRDDSALAADLAEGYITEAGRKRDYGR